MRSKPWSMGPWVAAAWLLAAGCSQKEAPALSSVAPAASAAARENPRCQSKRTALLSAPTEIEWSTAGKRRELRVDSAGVVLDGDRAIARTYQNCLLASDGTLLASVGEDDHIFDGTGEDRGQFEYRKQAWTETGVRTDIGGVVLTYGTKSLILSDRGDVWQAKAKKRGVALPAKITLGDKRGRKLALLLVLLAEELPKSS